MKLTKFHIKFFLLPLIGLILLIQNSSAASPSDTDSQLTPPAPDDEQESESNFAENVTDTERNSRFLPVLAVVRLHNLQCSSNGQLGVCKTQKQCDKDGGMTFGGSCGTGGSGVCCMQSASCPTTNSGQPTSVSASGTHLTQPPMYQAPFQCQFTFPRKTGICQIRLDFVTFNLAGPDVNGDCSTDSLTISGADNIPNFITCGTNTVSQHLYLQYGSSQSISVNLNINRATPVSMYDIMVTLIDCGEGSQNSKKRKSRKSSMSSMSLSKYSSMMSSNKNKNNNNNNNNDDIGMIIEPAPPGCAQYYTRPSDTVASFNYAQVPENALDTTQFQINNEQYTVCVKDPSGSNQITWQLCSQNDVFSVSGPYPPLPQAQASLLPCITDYVDIPGSNLGRYCGASFPGPVTSIAKPYIMYVNFDAQELYGQNFPIDPATGCPAGFTDCWVQGVLQRPGDPNVMLPCGPNFPDSQCVANSFAQALSDFNNIGFCLRYTVS